MAEEVGYGKRPLWQWIVIYGIIAVVVYGLIYYFIVARRGGNSPAPTSPMATVTPAASSEASSPATPTSSEEMVILTETGYSPAKLTIKAGTKVIWSNRSGKVATVNSDPHPAHTNYPALNLRSFSQGETLSLTFDQSGTYSYHNHLNPNQTGEITVE